MYWYKIKESRINWSNIKIYKPKGTNQILIDELTITFKTKQERDEELRKLDEALEKGLHTISEFQMP